MINHFPDSILYRFIFIFNPVWLNLEYLKLKKKRQILALLSCITKIYERMVKYRLEWWIKSNDVFPKTLFGFRSSMSTMDELVALISNIKLFLTYKKFKGLWLLI